MTLARPKWLNLTLLLFLFVGASVVVCLHMSDFHWRMGLLSHFCMQHLIGLSCLALVALCFRAWKTLVAFLLLIGFCFLPMVPLFFDASRHTFEQDFKAGLINLNGGQASIKEVMARADRHEVDLLCFVGVTPALLQQLEAQRSLYPHQLSQPQNGANGVAILSKEPSLTSSHPEFGRDGLPSIVATYQLQGQPLTVIVTNEPAVDSTEAAARRDRRLAAIVDHVQKLPGEDNIILAGNFNLAPFNAVFQRLVNQTGLFNSAHGFGYQPTWPSWLSISSTPIDHILLSKNLLVADRQVGPSIGAEHYPIWVGLGFASTKE